MHIEKRELRGKVKYYLSHSYREDGKVKKIRKYLGRDLSKRELEKVKNRAEAEMQKLLEGIQSKVFAFYLLKQSNKNLNEATTKNGKRS